MERIKLLQRNLLLQTNCRGYGVYEDDDVVDLTREDAEDSQTEETDEDDSQEEETDETFDKVRELRNNVAHDKGKINDAAMAEVIIEVVKAIEEIYCK